MSTFLDCQTAAHAIQTAFSIINAKNENNTLHQRDRRSGSIMELIL